MSIKGDLKSINLANVLQDLAANELTGTLVVQSGDRRRHFWFEKGKLRLVGMGNGKGPSPLNGLIALGKVRPTEIAPPSKRTQQATIVRSLMKKGAVGTDEVRAALEQQMSEQVCDVFVWSDATFEFAEGDADEDVFETSQLDWEIRIQGDPIIMEALRRVDEWGEIQKAVLSPEEILVRVDGRVVPESDATVERVQSFLDGERRLRDVMDQTHLSQFAVFRAAAALLRAGAVRHLSTTEAFTKARAAAAKKQHEQALRLARFALEREPNNLDLRAVAAECLEALERTSEAVSEYRQLAAAQIEQGRKADAVSVYRRILTLAPRDTFAHERLFHLLLELGRKDEALQQGEAMAAAYKRAGLADRAKEVYSRLIATLGDDDELLRAAADLARHLGDKKEALGFYRKLFDRALARGDDGAVVELSRTMLRLDPSLEDVARRRMEVETGVYRRRQAKRRRLRSLATTVIVLAVLAGLVAYEVRARIFLAKIREDAIRLLAEQQYRPLLVMYQAFLAKYPWSLASADARAERDRLERRFADIELLRLESPASNGALLDQFLGAQEVRYLLRLPDTRERAERCFARLREEVGRLSNGFIRETRELGANPTTEALEKIRAIDHPLALQALEDLARDESSAVRAAAVAGLGRNRSAPALQTLVALLTDPATMVRASAESALKEISGQNFGSDPNKWSEWLRRNVAPGSGGRAALLQAVIPTSWQRLPLSQRPMVEWRLLNIGSSSQDFLFDYEFEITGPGGVRAAAKPRRSGESRRLHLNPGEYLGGASDLREFVSGLDAPGTYRVRWIARVNWGGAGEVRIPSLEALLELVEASDKKQ